MNSYNFRDPLGKRFEYKIFDSPEKRVIRKHQKAQKEVKFWIKITFFLSFTPNVIIF
jgi:hypothetical protein